jgi:hypothetical protein
MMSSLSLQEKKYHMAAVTCRNLSEEAHRALKVRAASHGRSIRSGGSSELWFAHPAPADRFESVFVRGSDAFQDPP